MEVQQKVLRTLHYHRDSIHDFYGQKYYANPATSLKFILFICNRATDNDCLRIRVYIGQGMYIDNGSITPKNREEEPTYAHPNTESKSLEHQANQTDPNHRHTTDNTNHING